MIAGAALDRSPLGAPLCLLLVAFIVCAAMGMALVRNQEHADALHKEAPAIRVQIENARHGRPNGGCEGLEFWFSPSRGTFLTLCGLPGQPGVWGGQVIRVTENLGQQWLGAEAYEASCFAASRKYWNRVIQRDGYAPLATFPNIERLIRGEYFQ